MILFTLFQEILQTIALLYFQEYKKKLILIPMFFFMNLPKVKILNFCSKLLFYNFYLLTPIYNNNKIN